MSYDDDLFDDNDVQVTDEIVQDIDPISEDDKIFTDSPQFKELIESIQRELKNVDNFSFILYTKIYQNMIDHLNWMFRALSDDTAVHFITVRHLYNEIGEYNYNQIQKLKELERSIIVAGYFNGTIEHSIAQLKDNPAVSISDSFVKYTYDHLMREHAMSSFYLGTMIDKYVDYCQSLNFEMDQLLVESHIPSTISVLERQVYGEYIHAAEIEYVGQFPDAVDLKDEHNSSTAKILVEFVFATNRIIEKIKTGDTNDLMKEFRTHE